MNKDFIDKIYIKHQEIPRLPSTSSVSKLITRIMLMLFPEQSKKKFSTPDDIAASFKEREKELEEILESMKEQLPYEPAVLAREFFKEIPVIYEHLIEDINAIVLGDPAANTEYEVIRAYPGFYAIAFYRLAHALFKLKVPLLPRVITEFAHSKTGIDIHPGAEIQPHFFIDHGTGIVIGETAKIGRNVKLYQSVTLGALSVSKDMAETKRHPTIEDNVVIYSGATILGGKTVIGQGSVIGGNVWLTQSVPPYSKVYFQGQTKVTQDNNQII